MIGTVSGCVRRLAYFKVQYDYPCRPTDTEPFVSTRAILLHIGLSPSRVTLRVRLPSSNMSCILRTLPRPSLEQVGLTRASLSMFCDRDK